MDEIIFVKINHVQSLAWENAVQRDHLRHGLSENNKRVFCLIYIQELKQYPSLRMEVGSAACESLERMRDESKKATLKLVDMECCYPTVAFFRKLPQDIEKGGNPTHSIFDRYNDSYLRRVGTNVLSYVNMVCAGLRNPIPKSIVHCQVREAKRSLLDHFFTELGKKEALASLLNEDPAVME